MKRLCIQLRQVIVLEVHLVKPKTVKDLWRQCLQLVVRDVQAGEVFQVEQLGIQFSEIVVAQVDH